MNIQYAHAPTISLALGNPPAPHVPLLGLPLILTSPLVFDYQHHTPFSKANSNSYINVREGVYSTSSTSGASVFLTQPCAATLLLLHSCHRSRQGPLRDLSSQGCQQESTQLLQLQEL